MISADTLAEMKARVTPYEAQLYRDLSIGLQHAYNDLHEHRSSLYSQAPCIATPRIHTDEARITFIQREIATLIRGLLKTEDSHLIAVLDKNPCLLLEYESDIFRKN
jgi:hypothetical protein